MVISVDPDEMADYKQSICIYPVSKSISVLDYRAEKVKLKYGSVNKLWTNQKP